VSRSTSNACNPLAPRIDKNLGNPVVKRCRSVRLRIVGGYVFYPSTSPFFGDVAREKASLHHLVCI
jgi:hypothetical protein